MRRIAVLAPDKGSGEAFYEAMKGAVEGKLELVLRMVSIAPRVQPDGTLSGGEAGKRVEDDLQRELVKVREEGFGEAAVACNTLQLFLGEAAGLRVYTTFEALEGKYGTDVWLGTTPLCRWVETGGKFRTWVGMDMKVQEKVQEVIWLVKGWSGDDVSNAPNDLRRYMGNRAYLIKQVEEVLERGREEGVAGYILGCTEWPVAVRLAGEQRGGLRLVDPAVELGKFILNLEL